MQRGRAAYHSAVGGDGAVLKHIWTHIWWGSNWSSSSWKTFGQIYMVSSKPSLFVVGLFTIFWFTACVVHLVLKVQNWLDIFKDLGVETVSCKSSLKPIHWSIGHDLANNINGLVPTSLETSSTTPWWEIPNKKTCLDDVLIEVRMTVLPWYFTLIQ
jgi:hypothetical protein